MQATEAIGDNKRNVSRPGCRFEAWTDYLDYPLTAADVCPLPIRFVHRGGAAKEKVTLLSQKKP